MKSGFQVLTKTPLFAILFSVYPGLALLSTNIREVDITAAWRLLLLSASGALALNILLFQGVKDKTKASLITTIFLLLFFSYGHLVRFIVNQIDADYDAEIQVIFYAISVVILVTGSNIIKRTKRDLGEWIRNLNTVALILALLPVIQIAFVLISSATSQETEKLAANSNETQQSQTLPSTSPSSQYPDIYYIILDGYSRQDTMEALGYNNSEFVNSLKDMGFYVASCSASNYRSTLLSIPSSLNMNYLWDAVPNTGADDSNAKPLYDALVHSRVRSELEQRGYKIISFQTGYQWDEWTDADVYLTPTKNYIADKQSTFSITPFEYIFLKNTALYPFLGNSRFAVQRFYDHFNQVTYSLEELSNVAKIPGPKFVYAHILAPHYPFIFLPNGSLNTDHRYYDTEEGTPSNSDFDASGYLNNVKFLNSKVPNAIEAILKESKTPPIIVIQGDHGFVIPERRYNILNAYYLPGKTKNALYPTISPVNTFRIIFNQYFDTKLELLEDIRVNADAGKPYRQGRIKPFPETCPQSSGT